MKTPEEMAEEWASKRTYIITINDTTTTIAKEGFLAGYKAGYGRGFCEAGNVEWKHALEEAKKQNGNTESDGKQRSSVVDKDV
jgi:hypothetical protein